MTNLVWAAKMAVEKLARRSADRRKRASPMSVTAHAYDYEEADYASPSGQRTYIRMWCLDDSASSKACAVTVRGFQPWLYLELPSGVNWTAALADSLAQEIAQSVEIPILKSELVKRKKLYYYQPASEPGFDMLRVEVQCIDDARRLASTLDRRAALRETPGGALGANGSKSIRGGFYGRFGWLVLRAWEAPGGALTCARKLLTELDLKFSSWFALADTEAVSVTEPDSLGAELSVREYTVDCTGRDPYAWKTALAPAPELDAPRAPSRPGVLSFDIESYSDNPKMFPDRTNPVHAAYMISCVYQVSRSPETRKRYLIYLDDCGVSDDASHAAYTEPGVTVDEFIPVADEGDLVRAFCDLIARLDPEVLIGYNIFGFDYQYLDCRWRIFSGSDTPDEWPIQCTRAPGCENTIPKIKRSEWQSGTYGIVENFILQMAGRISVDMMTIVKREHKLQKYGLDAVFKHFFPDEAVGKLDVTPVQMFAAYEAGTQTSAEVRAATMQPDSPERVAAVAEMSRVAAYAVRDSEVVMDLFDKLNVWIGIVEMSTASGVPVSWTYTRGQTIRVLSLLYDITAREKVVLDKRRPPRSKADAAAAELDLRDRIPYTGGAVSSPVVGMNDFVIILDFASLYPSIMRAYNLCMSTLLVENSPLEDKWLSGWVAREQISRSAPGAPRLLVADPPKLGDPRFTAAPDTPVNSVTFVEGSAVSLNKKSFIDSEIQDSDSDAGSEDDNPNGAESGAKFEFSFVQSSVHQGYLPRLVERLVNMRSEVRKRLKSEKDPVMCEVLHQRQLAYKVTANSTYGFVGAQKTDGYSCAEVAMSITAYGRQLIGQVNDYLCEKYNGRIVYGDTDSTMIQIPGVEDSVTAWEWAERLERETSELFPDPLRMEAEKVVRILCIKKKFYAALQYSPPGMKDKAGEVIPTGTILPGMYKRGIVTERRDRCKTLTTVYARLVEMILREQAPVEEAFLELYRMISKMLRDGDSVGAVPFEIVKQMGAGYKNPASEPMAVLAALSAQDGKPIRPGERVGYVMVREERSPPPGLPVKPGSKSLRMLLRESWESATPRPELDMMYYLENMMNQVDLLFTVAYGEEMCKRGLDAALVQRYSKSVVRRCTRPVKLLHGIASQMRTEFKRKKAEPVSVAEIADAAEMVAAKFIEECRRLPMPDPVPHAAWDMACRAARRLGDLAQWAPRGVRGAAESVSEPMLATARFTAWAGHEHALARAEYDLAELIIGAVTKLRGKRRFLRDPTPEDLANNTAPKETPWNKVVFLVGKCYQNLRDRLAVTVRDCPAGASTRADVNAALDFLMPNLAPAPEA